MKDIRLESTLSEWWELKGKLKQEEIGLENILF
jgi:hypothetical protein